MAGALLLISFAAYTGQLLQRDGLCRSIDHDSDFHPFGPLLWEVLPDIACMGIGLHRARVQKKAVIMNMADEVFKGLLGLAGSGQPSI